MRLVTKILCDNAGLAYNKGDPVGNSKEPKLATPASQVAFGGGSGYGDVAGPVRRRPRPAEEEKPTPVWRSKLRNEPADEMEVFLFPLKGPVRGALSRLMELLEAVVDDPLPLQLSVVSGPLGYVSSIRALKPGIIPQPPSQFSPVVR